MYTNVWSDTTPVGSEAANTIDNIFRSLKVDLEQRFVDIFAMPNFTADPLRPYGLKFTDAQDSRIYLGDNAGTPRGLFVGDKTGANTYVTFASNPAILATKAILINGNQVPFQVTASTVVGKMYADSSNAYMAFGTFSGHDIVFFSNSSQVGRWATPGGLSLFGGLTVTAGSSSFQNIAAINAALTGYVTVGAEPVAGALGYSPVNGLALRGKAGSGNRDFIILTPAGGSILTVPSGTTNIEITGSLLVDGTAITAAGYLIGLGTPAVGGVGYTTSSGFTSRAKTGTVNDWAIVNAIGNNSVVAVPTGTNNFSITSQLIVGTGLTVVSGTSALQDVTAVGITATNTITTPSQISGGAFLNTAIGAYSWTGRSVLRSPSNGNITLLNTAETDFSILQFGGTTSAFPGLKRNGANLDLILADNSGFANLQAKNFISNGDITLTGKIVVGGSSGITVTAAEIIVGDNGAGAKSNVCLDLQSSTRVMIIPRIINLTGDIVGEDGMMAFNVSDSQFYKFAAGNWHTF